VRIPDDDGIGGAVEDGIAIEWFWGGGGFGGLGGWKVCLGGSEWGKQNAENAEGGESAADAE
jgi:hypothetical protein